MRTFLTVFLGGCGGVVAIFLFRLIGFGPELDAAILEALGRDNLSTVVSSDGSLLMGLMLAFALAWVAADVPRASQRWLLGLMAVVLVGTGTLVLSLYQFLYSPVAPIIGGFFGLAFTAGLTRIGPGAFRRHVDEIFGNTLNRKALRSLYDGSAAAVQSSHRLRASVLVLEATNHAELMAVMEPSEFAEMNRMYFSLASDFLCESGGFLENCTGVQVRAVFGVPHPLEEPGIAASRAALELVSRLHRLNLEADERFHHMLEFHLGVATGEVICGAFGAPRGLPYAVVGPPVELANRLVAAAPHYGCALLACMDTYREAGSQLEVRPIDLIQDQDNNDAEIYEILAPEGKLTPERKRSRDHFWNGVTHTRARRWDEAVAEFSKARIKGIPDAPLDFYLRRIERLRQGPASAAATSTELLPLSPPA